MVNRIKVVNDVGELVTIFHAADTDVKRKLLLDLSTGWITMPQIDEKYGVEGKKALLYLDKIKMVESQWITGDKGPEKAYHTYYTNIQINLIGSMPDLADIIYATTLTEKELEDYENKIKAMMVDGGVFIGTASENLNISQTLLKGIINRSSVLYLKGYRIEMENNV
ncbi:MULTISPECIES: ArsR family transcriptional regulator [Acidiplasma]|jgi:predicted DNA-binding ArsR family transcriptional regulator|uniref:ArsR family transcriptional regulator n=2 Tax=Acidiplasma TaxID=507753 RepID=A0A0Q0XLV0_9ARCH|nr:MULTISPECIES: ArsR family transcriptional regulator [Acidiplasma]KJE49600.1 ArsR family transcriptional regulator [Acidiplasma sp. MBA-1]KPV46149.1 ArsR family transcriptional regulator [Acidiplasma aeolicum]KQB33821.1 ArsR family transcriptional regulator [Acidiplasma aeolicum]KQB36415.1 ArsR family transcriptional regulator [Acidiplasma cupricumulans]WMT55853.1 MAG: ArsR family transcriptional regulator [Acidiplasma sp.]